MVLDKETNYIVSGLERSGTSLLMQILHAGGVPIGFDESRSADENNPKGYFELEGGKIINKLMAGTFPLGQYKGQFIKITAYGLQFLPLGRYTIIYSERNLDEILDSMEKMARITDTNREETKKSFEKLNVLIKKLVTGREDMRVLFVRYHDVVSNTEQVVQQIYDFLGVQDLDVYRMISVVDKRLHRQKRASV
ncbi:MAG: sulfotransferase [Methanobacteriota archaeon]